MILSKRLLAATAALALLIPADAFACACGCGLFDVGDGTVTPVASDSGLSVWLRYDYVNQDQNYEQGHRAPSSDNTDKRIETSFFTIGGEAADRARYQPDQPLRRPAL